MRKVELFIPHMPPSTNAIYSGMHWAKRKKEADKVHALAEVEASHLEPFDKPVVIVVQALLGKGARRRDCSNMTYALKLIEDGLVASGLLAGDEQDKVAFIGVGRSVIDRKRSSGVIVTVMEYGESNMKFLLAASADSD